VGRRNLRKKINLTEKKCQGCLAQGEKGSRGEGGEGTSKDAGERYIQIPGTTRAGVIGVKRRMCQLHKTRGIRKKKRKKKERGREDINPNPAGQDRAT